MTIGFEPIVDTLILVSGQDFLHDIFPPTGLTIPAGTSANLIFYDPSGTTVATWAATVSSASVSWDVASTVADTITIPAHFRIYVHYSDGKDFCWYRGQTARQE